MDNLEADKENYLKGATKEIALTAFDLVTKKGGKSSAVFQHKTIPEARLRIDLIKVGTPREVEDKLVFTDQLPDEVDSPCCLISVFSFDDDENMLLNTSYGRLPERFIDNQGKAFEIVRDFLLNPKGQGGSYLHFRFLDESRLEGRELDTSILPRINIEMPPETEEQSVFKKLVVGDLEYLKEQMNLVIEGVWQ